MVFQTLIKQNERVQKVYCEEEDEKVKKIRLLHSTPTLARLTPFFDAIFRQFERIKAWPYFVKIWRPYSLSFFCILRLKLQSYISIRGKVFTHKLDNYQCLHVKSMNHYKWRISEEVLLTQVPNENKLCQLKKPVL